MGYFRSSYNNASGGKDYSTTYTVSDSIGGIHKASCIRRFDNNSNLTNESIVIGNNVYTCEGMFHKSSFNGTVTMSMGISYCQNMFADSNFNNTITFVEGSGFAVNCAFFLSNCIYYNQPINLHNRISNLYQAFGRCNNFNQSVNIDTITYDCDYSMAFYFCNKLNSPITINHTGINSLNLSCIFNLCNNLNQNVVIMSNAKRVNCYGMFENLPKFNSNVTIPENADCTYMFHNCSNFNQNIQLPLTTTNCLAMFYNCSNFSQTVYIPKNVGNVREMFGDCNKMEVIYLNNTNYQLAQLNDVFTRRTTSKAIRVYSSGTTYNSLKNMAILLSNGTHVTGISYTTITNGCYNSAYNIYLYNNHSNGL